MEAFDGSEAPEPQCALNKGLACFSPLLGRTAFYPRLHFCSMHIHCKNNDFKLLYPQENLVAFQNSPICLEFCLAVWCFPISDKCVFISSAGLCAHIYINFRPHLDQMVTAQLVTGSSWEKRQQGCAVQIQLLNEILVSITTKENPAERET